MKKTLISAAALFLCLQSFAQTNSTDSLPTYEKYPEVPAFSLSVLPDSTTFTKADLKKKEPVIMIMFSPDCEHCQRETDSIIAHYNLFKKVQIVMASPLDYVHIKDFYKKYKIADYPNITMGKDPVWALGQFYKVRNFPTIVVYNKEGKFVKLFEGSVRVENVAAVL